jgi:hypothetical protein
MQTFVTGFSAHTFGLPAITFFIEIQQNSARFRNDF